MCKTSPPSFCPSCDWLYACLTRWTKPLLMIFGGLLLLILAGMLVSKLGGKDTDTVYAHTDKPSQGESERH